jgi:hypothetical protein
MEVRSIEVIVKALNDAKVKYLFVGGLAVVAHGYERFTADVDIVVGLERENITRGLNALFLAGWRMMIPVTAEDFADPKLREFWRKDKKLVAVRLWSNLHKRTPIDLFIYEPFDFEKEYKRAKWETLAGGLPAPIVSYEALIAMKKEAGREKDMLDIAALAKLDPYR